jgi:hypothetical protein
MPSLAMGKAKTKGKGRDCEGLDSIIGTDIEAFEKIDVGEVACQFAAISQAGRRRRAPAEA